MGIPFYYVSLIRTHPEIVRTIVNMKCDILALDFNCLIHKYLEDIDPIQSVIRGLKLVMSICQAKKTLVYFDGLVPYAKIVQQRYRRMRGKECGIFDRNQISPDTPYMRELELELEKIADIEISGTTKSGEGEHKIFRDLRKTQVQKTVIYGLDADLILLSVYHHNLASEMYLLRESQEMNAPGEFSVLLCTELAKVLPLDREQYLILCILCFGNDFMPNLGLFSLREGGYQRALDIYKISGNPDLTTQDGRFKFLHEAQRREWEFMKERKMPFEKMVIGKDLKTFSRKYGLHVLDGIQNMEFVVEAYWKTFHWTLEYFTKSKSSNWNWVYPYSDAPLLTDIVEFYESEITSEPTKFTISKQLGFILPSRSLKAAKRRQVYPDEIYTETRPLWIKRHDWEMKPFVSLPWNPSAKLTSICPL
jgi:5'-3' exonuclease